MSISPSGIDCYLGLGSNLDNPPKQIKKAIQLLSRSPGIQFIQSAPWYQSKAWGVIDQNDFVNTVIKINTRLRPIALIKTIKTIEYRLMQRQLNKKWHERIIDIDVLIYGRETMNRPQLKIPHPYLTQRCFVIEPLLVLKPELSNQLRKDIKKHQNNHSCISSLEILYQPSLKKLYK